MLQNVLILHNSYLESGGEDTVVAQEGGLLKSFGHRVETLKVTNEVLVKSSAIGRAANLALGNAVATKLESIIASAQPDLIHLHNWMPRIGTLAYKLSEKYQLPLVQTLHNYRLACLNGLLLRDGQICERCLAGFPLSGIAFGCYRGSSLASIAAAGIQLRVRAGIGRGHVAALIVVSEFQRQKLASANWFPRDRVWVKPNYVDAITEVERSTEEDPPYFLFVGRLSQEKGLQCVIKALRASKVRMRLEVVGAGPEEANLKAMANDLDVIFRGALTRRQVVEKMARARALVFPSICYEGMPMVILEALSVGLPVIATDLGGVPETVGEAGWCIPAGDTNSWRRKLEEAWLDPSTCRDLYEVALQRYESNYSPTANYRQLKTIYDAVTG